jgi:hypothetical protein
VDAGIRVAFELGGWVWLSLVHPFFSTHSSLVPLELKREADTKENRVIAILLLIHRSKLVLDFALTLHLIHLLVTSFYSHSIPTNALWWALQFTSAALMTSLGVWTCQWRELRPINFGGSSTSNDASNAQVSDGAQQNIGDEEQGFGRGRGRGRGRDGAGEYEMVTMKDAEPS